MNRSSPNQLDMSYMSSNMSSNYTESMNSTNLTYGGFDEHFQNLINLITIVIGLPLTLVLIIAVFQLKNDQGPPVYIINLFISDLVQLCSRIPMCLPVDEIIPGFFWGWGISASVGFMMCISVERYLVIAKAVWYKFRKKRKISIVVCIVVWVFPLPVMLTIYFTPNMIYLYILLCIFLLPFPLFIFCLLATIKALSGAHSVPVDEKRRIVAILLMVLVIYTVLFLPFITWFLVDMDNLILTNMVLVCVYFSPLADTVFYMLIRKSLLDKVLASLFFCKMSTSKKMSSTDTESTDNNEMV